MKNNEWHSKSHQIPSKSRRISQPLGKSKKYYLEILFLNTIYYLEGGSAGKTPNFEKLKNLFYKYKEWDTKTGKPSETKLKQLGLDKL